MTETVASIVAAHRAGTTTPEDTVRRTYRRIREHNDPAIFISLRDEEEAVAEAAALKGRTDLPLWGVPVAVKDNIDVAGLTTTAACPAFAYQPQRDATAVAKLRAAGAIVIGKTNLDQFATGLVGVRSPYGIPKNPIRGDLIPGGSSSGSAVAVSAGLVPLSLGTDTAGSGRVPAMLNNIVGLKPSLGLVSTSGLVPACRTLDCISIFALTVDDAMRGLAVIAGYDEADDYARRRPLASLGQFPDELRIGVPMPGQLEFFGDALSAAAYDATLTKFVSRGAKLVEFDLEPFYETARLLYEGPWVAERFLVANDLLASDPEALHPVTRAITEVGDRLKAPDVFASLYKLERLRRVSERAFCDFDTMILPTAPTAYTVKEVLADPVQLNSRLGTYTNFVNLLDLCGLAIPMSMRSDGMPFGVTLLAPGGRDAMLASIGRVIHADTGLALGARGVPRTELDGLPMTPSAGEIAIVAVGAHLSGLPLNHELLSLGGRLLQSAKTAANYRLYALKNTVPPKPGLARVAEGGTSIAVEIWALPVDGFARFVAAVPAPLTIGSIQIEDGRSIKGFLAEPVALEGARDISQFGGWRAFLESAVNA